MADKQIITNSDTVSNILIKISNFKESLESELSQMQRVIENAEMEGWSDKHYEEFSDKFYETKVYLNDVVKNLDEDLIPYLRNIIKAIDDF